MTELWEILLPRPDDWPIYAYEHVGSVYVPRGTSADDIILTAKCKYGRKALAYRRSGSETWKMITHERIY